jgi:hypothetical protein
MNEYRLGTAIAQIVPFIRSRSKPQELISWKIIKKGTIIGMSISAMLLILSITITTTEAKSYDTGKYTFDYPNECKLTERENRFTSRDASLECNGKVMIFESGTELSQSLASHSDSKILEVIEGVAESLYNDASIFESGTDKYVINNKTAPYIIATFAKEGLFKNSDMVVLGILIQVGDEAVFVQYMANANDFDGFLPKAEQIFESIRPI